MGKRNMDKKILIRKSEGERLRGRMYRHRREDNIGIYITEIDDILIQLTLPIPFH